MMWKKLTVLMILMLLFCLKSWSQDNSCDSLYRVSSLSDTSIVKIPINYIKKANIKLIEREYLIEENKEKDSIIAIQNNYINFADFIIDSLCADICYKEDINNDIKFKLENEKKQNDILKIGIGGVIIGVITTILIK